MYIILMQYYNQIYDDVSLPNISVVYLAIGSSMFHYSEITQSNNQQYPCFLEKFGGHQVIILIDPFLEEELKLVNFYLNYYGKKLDLKQSIKEADKIVFRKYQNNDITVYALNREFFFETNQYHSELQNKQTDEDVSFLINLIFQCLGKIKKTKVIVQDYTGFDTTNFYSGLFNIFEKQELLENVIFDVTQKDGGCFIEIRPEYAGLDNMGNFTQERYMFLTDIRKKGSVLFSSIYQSRIDQLNYPLVFNYKKLLENSLELVRLNNIKTLAKIYSVEYDEGSADINYQLNKHLVLIKQIISDLITSKQVDSEVEKYLLDNLTKGSGFINAVSILRYVD